MKYFQKKKKKHQKTRFVQKKYQDCCYANGSKVCRVKLAWHRLTLNSVVHAHRVVTFLLTSIVYISAWKESGVISLYHRSSISDYDLCSSFLTTHTKFDNHHIPQILPLVAFFTFQK